MKKILLLTAVVCGLGFTGCAVSRSTSIKTVNVGPEAVRPLPLTADLNVSEQKVRGEAQDRVGADPSVEERTVRLAVARALGQDPPKVEAPDVLVAMNVYKEKRGRDSLRVVVTGYPAWYHNFRTAPETGDSAWLILTNTSGGEVKQSGFGGNLLDSDNQWWLGVAKKKDGMSRKGHYFGASRMLGGTLPNNEWLALEVGWLKSSGLFYGFEFGGGVGGDNYSISAGFNMGSTYDLPSGIAQLVYGMSVGEWADMYHYVNANRDEYYFDIGIAGPFVKLRWKFIELAYRGLMGYIGEKMANDPDAGVAWFNQYKVGVYFEF